MEAKSFCFPEIIGVGYKASTNPQGSISYPKSGFSHEIRIQVAPSVRRVSCLKPNPYWNRSSKKSNSICCQRKKL